MQLHHTVPYCEGTTSKELPAQGRFNRKRPARVALLRQTHATGADLLSALSEEASVAKCSFIQQPTDRSIRCYDPADKLSR